MKRLILALIGTGALLVGCAANDPFDPSTVPNEQPTVRLYAAPIDPDGELSATSYNERTFYWSGSDKDGWITEFHISVRTDRDVPAPWAVTQRTDTTMTFVTDELGRAEATIYLVSKDNRGALSDTLIRLLPLKNLPPVINFKGDFNPQYNMQREIIDENKTIFWNWGVTNFRMFAYDPDGSSTMDSFFRYTLSDTEPEITQDYPDGDPETEWIKVDFANPKDQVHEFELVFRDVAPGDPRKLTISLIDEGMADTRFEFEWIVREPKGDPGSRVLFVQEGARVPEVFEAALDSTYGTDGWDLYRFWAQFPDKPFILLDTFRKFDLVIWGNNGGASGNLEDATGKEMGILKNYVNSYAGKLFMFSPTVTGYSSTLGAPFHKDVLGVHSLSDSTSTVTIPVGKLVQGLEPHLLTMTSQYVYPELKAVRLDPLVGMSEIIYRMEYCPGCYGSRNAPTTPFIGARRPLRSSGLPAQVVTLGFTPENFYDPDDPESTQTVSALRAILEQELEVVPQ